MWHFRICAINLVARSMSRETGQRETETETERPTYDNLRIPSDFWWSEFGLLGDWERNSTRWRVSRCVHRVLMQQFRFQRVSGWSSLSRMHDRGQLARLIIGRVQRRSLEILRSTDHEPGIPKVDLLVYFLWVEEFPLTHVELPIDDRPWQTDFLLCTYWIEVLSHLDGSSDVAWWCQCIREKDWGRYQWIG